MKPVLTPRHAVPRVFLLRDLLARQCKGPSKQRLKSIYIIELKITGTIRSTGRLKPNYASRTQPFHEKNKHGQNKNIDRQTGQNSRKTHFTKM